MRISIVHSFYSSKNASGENSVVQAQAGALREHGHDVQLISQHSDAGSASRMYPIQSAWRVSTGNGYDPTDEIRLFSPDAIHVHNLFPNFSTKWLQHIEVPIVATMHNFRPMCAAATLFRKGAVCTKCPDGGQHHAIINACYRNSPLASVPLAISNAGGLGANRLLQAAKRIIYLSPRSRRIFETYGAPPTKSAVLPNFSETSKSIGGHTERWIYAGRLTQEKGIAKLIDMWPRGTPLDVYGSGPEEKIVAQLASGKDVTLHGLVPSSTVNRAVRQAAGVVLPSLWAEGIPTIYLESLAAGVPVLAHQGNSAADDIVKHGHGYVYSDEDSLLRGVQDILSHRAQYSDFSTKLHDSQYSKAAWVENVTEIYSTLDSLK